MFASRSYKQRFFIVECRETFFGCEVKLLHVPFFPLDGAAEFGTIYFRDYFRNVPKLTSFEVFVSSGGAGDTL